MVTRWAVTGAGRGLGSEFVRQLSARGDFVLGTVRDRGRPPLGAQRTAVLDASDSASIDLLPQQWSDDPIDVLVNNVGVSSEARTLSALTAPELARVFMVNSIAPVLIARQALPALRRGTRRIIINISSQLGSITNNAGPNGGGSSYAYRASKAALNMLTVSMSHELRPDGIACIAMHPGWVRTDMGGEKAPLSPEQSVRSMLSTIDRLTLADSGRFLNHDGTPIPY